MAIARLHYRSFILLTMFGFMVGCSPTSTMVAENESQVLSESPAANLLESRNDLFEGEPKAWDISNLPLDTPPARRTSDETFEVDGASITAESVGNISYSPAASPLSYAIVPGDESQLAWTRYSVGGLTGDKPVQLEVFASQASVEDGGDILPLNYYVAVANFTGFHWNWWGPFSGDAQFSINQPEDEQTAELSERYVSETGVLHFIVATGSALGGGNSGVQVDLATVTTSPAYSWNKPHYTWFVDAHAGSSVPKDARVVSALKPEQFISLIWHHIAAFGVQDVANAANEYTVSRQAPAESTAAVIGNLPAPGTLFVDPIDRDVGVAEPTPGTTYKYFIVASNTAGSTLSAQTKATVPILAPEGVIATLDGLDPGHSLVSWQAVDGALSYEVWRGTSPVAESSLKIGNTAGAEVEYLDTTAIPGMEYWYFVRSIGQGDGDESNGLEPGAMSGYSLGSKGLRRIELSISGIEPAVTGTGIEADPFMLLAGTPYQFKAFDQTGRELTIVCSWEVQPEGAGTFDAMNIGLLDGIQPAPNEFSVSANFSFSTYNWEASAFCTVE